MQSSTAQSQLLKQKMLQRSRIQLQPIIKAELLVQGSGGWDPPNNKQNEHLSLHAAYRKKQHALVSMENVAFKKRVQKRNILRRQQAEPELKDQILKGSNEISSERYSQSTHQRRQIFNKVEIRHSPLTVLSTNSNLIFNKSHKIQGILYNIESQIVDRTHLSINLKEDASTNKYSLKLPLNKAAMILKRYFLDDIDLLVQALAVDRQHKRCFIKLDRVNRRSKSQLPLINQLDEELEESLRQTHSSLTKDDETMEQVDLKKRFKTSENQTPLDGSQRTE